MRPREFVDFAERVLGDPGDSVRLFFGDAEDFALPEDLDEADFALGEGLEEEDVLDMGAL